MLNEQTHEKLIDMRLRGLAAAFQEYLDSPVTDELSFPERLGLMVDREWTERQQRRLKRRLGQAKLRQQACLEDVNYRHPRGLDRSVIQRLATCRWIAHHENVIITGPTGVGKTWLACALANQVCRQGHSTIYTRVPRLLHQLHIARGDGSYAQQLTRLAKADLLVLDDWGLATLEDQERRDMLEVLEDRHNLRSTIITSQLEVELWHDTVGDPTIADAILDRVSHGSHRLDLQGPSVRKALAEETEEPKQ